MSCVKRKGAHADGGTFMKMYLTSQRNCLLHCLGRQRAKLTDARAQWVIACATALIVSLVPLTAQAEASCSPARAAASWIFTDSGTVVGVGPRVAVGKFKLNAAGDLLNGVATSSLNGAIAEETFSGTYTVKSDCTGTINVEIFSSGTELFTVTLHIVFDEQMQHMNGIFTSVVTAGGTSLPTAIAFEARRD